MRPPHLHAKTGILDGSHPGNSAPHQVSSRSGLPAGFVCSFLERAIYRASARVVSPAGANSRLITVPLLTRERVFGEIFCRLFWRGCRGAPRESATRSGGVDSPWGSLVAVSKRRAHISRGSCPSWGRPWYWTGDYWILAARNFPAACLGGLPLPLGFPLNFRRVFRFRFCYWTPVPRCSPEATPEKVHTAWPFSICSLFF